MTRVLLASLFTSAFCFLPSAFANDLTVDRRTIRLNETLRITVSLEGAFAEVDRIRLPLQNLVVEGGPSVSSEFSWINGVFVRRKVFRYAARPLRPGAALVGPLVIGGEGGQRETLSPVAVQVIPDAAAGSNDPLTILRELVATGRDPLFVIAEVDRNSAWLGEEIVVTWYLYNAAQVQEWRITRAPKLGDFWSEELDVRHAQPVQTLVGTTVMQRVPIRRVALFPLESGRLTIDSLEIVGEVWRRIESGPFRVFDGSLVDVRYSSAHLAVDVRPLPSIDFDAVGDLTLRCSPPLQRKGGPVTFDVTLAGRGNLRGAAAPRLTGALAGDLQVEERGIDVTRTRESASMRRRWTYVVFPARSGRLVVPPLSMRVFSTAGGRAEELRCGGGSLDVQRMSAQAEINPPPQHFARRVPRRRLTAIAIGGIAGALLLGVGFVRTRRALRIRRMTQTLAHHDSLSAVRAAADAMLASRGLDPHTILTEASERGDAYRSLRSLLEALDRNRTPPAEARDEITARARDLVQSM